MEHYDRRLVTAPDWMKNFCCIAGDCPETCCQKWNIDVDPVHAECYTHLGDPDLQDILQRLLHKIRVRRPGKKEAETQYLLRLLKEEDSRCPLLNDRGECRLQKKFGAYILCDTCYFHPRTFCQIDEQIWLSACLSCPECARLALLHREPTGFVRFETEIDPNAEWLETSLMPDPGAQMLMRNRDAVISAMCTILQQRDIPIRERIAKAVRFLEKTGNILSPEDFTPGLYRDAAELLFAQIRQGRISISGIIGSFSDEESQEQAADIFRPGQLHDDDGECRKLAADSIILIRQHSLEQQMEKEQDVGRLLELKKEQENLRKCPFLFD